MVHPQANVQPESSNKVILCEIKKKFDNVKGLWSKQLHEVHSFFQV